MLRRNRKKEAPVNYLVKKASSNFKTMDYKYTYSNGTIHHHRTDCEHEEGDSKQNAGIFCIKRKTVRISHFLELSRCSWQVSKLCTLLRSVLNWFICANYQQQNRVAQILPNKKRSGSRKPTTIWKNPSALVKSLTKAQKHQLEAWHSLTVMHHNDADLQYVSVLKVCEWLTLQLDRILSEANTVSTFTLENGLVM